MSLTNPLEILAPLCVGPADCTASRDPLASLISGPLGAGLGLAVYDSEAMAGGLWHALLPDARLDPPRAAQRPGTFLDTGFAALLKAVQALGARPKNLTICVAGGGKILDDGADFDIGGRNWEALEVLLTAQGLKIHAAAAGGTENRTLHLHIGTGQIRSSLVTGGGEIILCGR